MVTVMPDFPQMSTESTIRGVPIASLHSCREAIAYPGAYGR